jgi:hypothetical protein
MLHVSILVLICNFFAREFYWKGWQNSFWFLDSEKRCALPQPMWWLWRVHSELSVRTYLCLLTSQVWVLEELISSWILKVRCYNIFCCIWNNFYSKSFTYEVAYTKPDKEWLLLAECSNKRKNHCSFLLWNLWRSFIHYLSFLSLISTAWIYFMDVLFKFLILVSDFVSSRVKTLISSYNCAKYLPLNILNFELGPTTGFMNLIAIYCLHVYLAQTAYIFYCRQPW